MATINYNNDVTAGSFSPGGDLSGNATSQTVVAIQGVPVSSAAPTTGQKMVFNGIDWIPLTPNYVFSFNAAPISAASTLSFSASAITKQGSGLFYVAITCCPVPNTVPTEIELQIVKDGSAIATIVQKTAPVAIGNDS